MWLQMLSAGLRMDLSPVWCVCEAPELLKFLRNIMLQIREVI